MPQTALIVDDDPTIRKSLSLLFVKKLGFSVIEAENGQQAIDIMANGARRRVDIVILDLNMPVLGGIETLESFQNSYPDLPVLMLTASQSVDDVVEAMRLGAMDFISKPIEAERFIVSVQNALKMNSLQKEVVRLQKTETGTLKFSDLIGVEGGLQPVIDVARKAAASDIPVLVTGQTGVGKDVIAQAIHGESARAGKPFIAVNCGAIPEKLVESTLFGHEKGAFTGALASSLGKFREVDGGTLFLDEVGELPLDTQVKLLRVLQQKEVEPVGSGQNIAVNVRIISATNRNLNDHIQQGLFREDLYFRLNVLSLDIPTLAQRKQDIPALADFFVSRFSAQEKKPLKIISEPAKTILKNHDWTGNIRQLENTIYRAFILSDNTILDVNDFVFLQNNETRSGPQINPIKADEHIRLIDDDGKLRSLKSMEADIIEKAIRHHQGNMTKAAQDLGVAKSTLYRKI